MKPTLAALFFLLAVTIPAHAQRQQIPLSGPAWQFASHAPPLQSDPATPPDFDASVWTPVTVPHVFQTRAAYNDVLQGWYRRTYVVPKSLAGKELYVMFEGAATIADVYVNGTHLGQHRGAYTRFLFDATKALHVGQTNTIAVHVDDDPADTADCLPSGSRLYKVWGGLYRRVWLLATAPMHIDPTDYASPGVYLTPHDISPAKATVDATILLRNTLPKPVDVGLNAIVLDDNNNPYGGIATNATIPAGGRVSQNLTWAVIHPRLWAPGTHNLYHVRVDILRGGTLVDSVTQPLGFRTLVFADGKVTLNGKPVLLRGVDLHQEIEAKASAMAPADFWFNYAALKDLGVNWLRLPHYPHAQIEYDLCDKLGILVWAENGHSNNERPSDTGRAITTEMVKQNYNHPSIAVWSVGNEASADAADAYVPVVKALDKMRPVAVANMASTLADFRTQHIYTGWYGKGDQWTFPTKGYVTETGGGGVVTTHCDYADAKHTTDRYEPEEYQQLVAEAHFQTAIAENTGNLGMLTWWTMRDFSDNKYKKPVGWNTKGLLTYGGDPKDVYYLYKCFLRPATPVVHITSKRYFLRMGAVANGIKVYSNAPHLALTLNGAPITTLANGAYAQTNGRHVQNVFYWPVPLVMGKNTVAASDGAGHSDTATLYFYGTGGAPALPDPAPLVQALTTSNPANMAYYMDMPVQPQWPIYYDLDSTADNSFDTLPTAAQGATWIALRRVTKPGQETSVSFTLARPATVFVMCTKASTPPAFLPGFTPMPTPELMWRDNSLQLVPAELYSHSAKAGEVIHIPAPDRDMIVLLKASPNP